jgi:hypothetical protein
MYILVCSLCALTAVLFYGSKKEDILVPQYSESLFNFRRVYLVAWSIAIVADWLQGPYVYALYREYGFTNAENAVLFVCGFGASGFFGVFIGQFADRCGRKGAAISYCLLVMASCATKHFKHYGVLMLGRILGGCATSLVFSVFESWMVSEHHMRHKFSDNDLSVTFGQQQFLSSVMAIAAGLSAQMCASVMPLTQVSGPLYVGGYCGPFDCAFICAGMGAVIIAATWSENYGEGGESETFSEGMGRAARYLQDKSIWMVGLTCSFYESAMFLWVFVWTPLITTEGTKNPPYGLIFTCFMVACMFGSKMFELMSKFFSAATLLVFSLMSAFVAHLLMIHGSKSKNMPFLLGQFILFEITVGLYFPAAGTLKGRLVPESCRATLYNLFRIPLNVIVVFALVFKSDPPVTLQLTCGLLALATTLAFLLHRHMSNMEKFEATSARESLRAADV